MHAVINHLSVSAPPPAAVVAYLQERALVEAKAISGILDVHRVPVDDGHLVMNIIGEDLEASPRVDR